MTADILAAVVATFLLGFRFYYVFLHVNQLRSRLSQEATRSTASCRMHVFIWQALRTGNRGSFVTCVAFQHIIMLKSNEFRDLAIFPFKQNLTA